VRRITAVVGGMGGRWGWYCCCMGGMVGWAVYMAGSFLLPAGGASMLLRWHDQSYQRSLTIT
jgi:hypothetical protein